MHASNIRSNTLWAAYQDSILRHNEFNEFSEKMADKLRNILIIINNHVIQ